MNESLVDALRRQGLTDVDDSALAKSLYASDASIYRIPPQVVVRPRDTDELAATLAVARETGVPLTMRGAGTSIAGNAIGPGIVVDTSRHLNRVLELDPEARTALVQPGVVHATLQRQAVQQGLRFGPDPSTHTRCTIGGMIGNNACGSRALGYGRTVDNVEALTVLLADGTVARRWRPRDHQIDALNALVDQHLDIVRTEFGRFGRQVSGYSFEHLLPERGRRFDRFLVGTEGTLGVVLDATVRLVEDAPVPGAGGAGLPDDGGRRGRRTRPARAPPRRLRGTRPADRAMVKEHPELPEGGGWLFAEVTAATAEEAAALANEVARAAGVPHRIVTDTVEQLALWRIREDGAGLAARSLSRPAQAGWEDAAVPPAKLGAYLRDFDALLKQSGLDGVPYGHFGDGCVHVRIDFELEEAGGRSHVPRVRRERCRPRRLLRRLDVGRARRRPRPLGAAPADVLPAGDRADAAGQADPRPRQPAQPRRARRPGAVRLRPAPGQSSPPIAYDAPAHPRRRFVLAGRCTVAPGWASASPTTLPPAA